MSADKHAADCGGINQLAQAPQDLRSIANSSGPRLCGGQRRTYTGHVNTTRERFYE
jgi:hypothetical protein